MFKFFDRFKAKAVAARESANDAYIRLVRKAAADGDLNDVDGAKLIECGTGLGYGQAEIEADIEALKQHARLEQLPSFERVEAARKSTDAELQAFNEQTAVLQKKFAEEREAKRATLAAAAEQAKAAWSAVLNGGREMTSIKKRAWRIFGGPAPAVLEAQRIEARGQRTLCRAFAPAPHNGMHVETATGNDLTNMKNMGIKFVRAAGQTEQEFQILLADAGAFSEGGRYLVEKADLAGWPLIVPHHNIADVFENLLTDTRGIHLLTPYVRWPHRSVEAHHALLQKLKAHWVKCAADKNINVDRPMTKAGAW